MLKKTLESLLDWRKVKPVHPKENNPEHSLEGLLKKLKLQYFGHLMWGASPLEKTLMLGKIEGKSSSRWQRMRWSDSISDLMGINLSKLWEIAKDRGPWHATVHGVAKSWTWLSDWTTHVKQWILYTNSWDVKQKSQSLSLSSSYQEEEMSNIINR